MLKQSSCDESLTTFLVIPHCGTARGLFLHHRSRLKVKNPVSITCISAHGAHLLGKSVDSGRNGLESLSDSNPLRFI